MKAVKWADKYTELAVVIATIVFISLFMSVQVISRKMFGYSIVWSEQLCRHMLIIMGFFGLSFTIRYENTIRFNLVEMFLPKTAQHFFAILVHVIMIVFFAAMIPGSWEVTLSMVGNAARNMPYDMSVLYAVVLVSEILVIIRCIQMTIIHIRRICNLSNGPDANMIMGEE